MAKLWTDIQNNLTFLLVCIGIIIGLGLIARIAEQFLPDRRKTTPARRISIIAICAAMATVLHIMDFPLPFLAPGFYKLDFSELPVMLCGFYLGPAATIACEGIKIVLKLLINGTTTAFVGDFANFFVGCFFVLPAVIVYHIRRKLATAIIGLSVGTFILTVFGSAFNGIYLLPKFAEMLLPMESIIAAGNAINPAINSVSSFVFLCVVPLNLIKGISVSVLTMLMYKRIARPLFEKI